MKEPVRWRDDGPEDARALLRHAPVIRDLTPEDRARTRARVARVAAIAAVGGGLTLVQSAAIGAGLAVVAVVAYAVVPAWMAPAQPSAPSSSVAPRRSASPPPSAWAARSAAPLGLPAAVASAAPRASTDPTLSQPSPRHPEARTPPDEAEAAPPPARAPDSLAQEAVLIEQARAALATSPAEALRRTEDHRAQFPAGKLSVERELVAIDALGRLGRSADARARGEALLAQAKGGLYEARLRKLLDGLP